MLCKNCGTEVPDNFQFCPSCGFKLEQGGMAYEENSQPYVRYMNRQANDYGADRPVPRSNFSQNDFSQKNASGSTDSDPGQTPIWGEYRSDTSGQFFYDNQTNSSHAQNGQRGSNFQNQQAYGYGNSQYGQLIQPKKSKVAAGLLAIFLGGLGIHKFYLGYSTAGLIMLLVSVVGSLFTACISAIVIGVIALIEGILYLTCDDEEFYYKYEKGSQQWF